MLQDFWKRIPWQVILLLFTIPFLLRNLLFRDNFIEGFLPIIIWESFLFIPVFLSWRAKYHLDKHILLFTSAGLMVLCAMMFAQYHGLKAIRTDRKVDWKIKNRESLYNKK